MKKLVRESLNENELSPLEKLHQTFSNVGYDVDELDEGDDGFWAENDNGIRAYIEEAGENFNILVQGMSDDVPIYDIEYRAVLDLFQDLDEEWLIENDPEGDQY